MNGSLPMSFLTASCTAGILEEPPTMRTLLISEIWSPLSLRACLTGPIVASTRSAVSSLNLACVSVRSRCLGVPEASTVMKGMLIFDVVVDESSILDFSAASLSLWAAILSCERSMPSVFLNSSTIQLMIRWSKSSPPRRLLPAVASTC